MSLSLSERWWNLVEVSRDERERGKGKKREKRRKQMYVLSSRWIKFEDGYGSREREAGRHDKKAD